MPTTAKCVICDDVLRHSLAKYCRTCGNIIGKIENRRKEGIATRVKALRAAWDKETGCFRCHYSGIALVSDNPRDPRYITFDELDTAKEGEPVITAALISAMKSDLSLDEFKTIIIQLAAHFTTGTPVDQDIFKFKRPK